MSGSKDVEKIFSMKDYVEDTLEARMVLSKVGHMR